MSDLTADAVLFVQVSRETPDVTPCHTSPPQRVQPSSTSYYAISYNLYICIYMHIYLSMCIYIYIYIFIALPLSLSTYIYIYISIIVYHISYGTQAHGPTVLRPNAAWAMRPGPGTKIVIVPFIMFYLFYLFLFYVYFLFIFRVCIYIYIYIYMCHGLCCDY